MLGGRSPGVDQKTAKLLPLAHNHIRRLQDDRQMSHSREDESMEAKARWFQTLPLPERMDLLCLLLVGRSHPALIVERPVDGPYIVVAELSDEGLIGKIVAQIELPYAVTGESDMVVRDNRLYVGSYGRLHILEYDANGALQIISSSVIYNIHVLHCVFVIERKLHHIVHIMPVQSPRENQ